VDQDQTSEDAAHGDVEHGDAEHGDDEQAHQDAPTTAGDPAHRVGISVGVATLLALAAVLALLVWAGAA